IGGLSPDPLAAEVAVPGVPQGLDQIAEVIVAAQEPGTGEDLDVGLLHQVLGQLARPTQRAGRSKERVDVVAGGLGVQPALLPLDKHRVQNDTAPSPFQVASLISSWSPTSALDSTQVRPLRHHVTTRRPPLASAWRWTPFLVAGRDPSGAGIPWPETIV